MAKTLTCPSCEKSFTHEGKSLKMKCPHCEAKLMAVGEIGFYCTGCEVLLEMKFGTIHVGCPICGVITVFTYPADGDINKITYSKLQLNTPKRRLN